MTQRILIVGIDSMIGGHVARKFAAGGLSILGTSRRGVNPDHLFLELRDDMERWPIPDGIDIACFFAGVTALRDCEDDPEGSRLVNVTATTTLARRLIERGVFVFFPSSNMVFDGCTPFVGASATRSPVNEYGRQQAAVEECLSAHPDRVTILRMTKVLSPGFRLFEDWRRALLANRPIEPFHDLQFAPITVRLVAGAIVALCSRRLAGVSQISGGRDISYADAAYQIAQRLSAPTDLVRPTEGSKATLRLAAVPRHTTLDTSRLMALLGIESADVWETIDAILGLSTPPSRAARDIRA